MLCTVCKTKAAELAQEKNQTEVYCQQCALNMSTAEDRFITLHLCEECESSPGAFQCAECEQVLCQDCEIKLHKKGARVHHLRKALEHGEKFFLKNLIIIFDLDTLTIDQEISKANKSFGNQLLPCLLLVHQSLQHQCKAPEVVFFNELDFQKIEKMFVASIYLVSSKIDENFYLCLSKLLNVHLKMNIHINGIKYNAENPPKKNKLLEELSLSTPILEKQFLAIDKIECNENSNTSFSTGLLQWQPLKEAEYDAVLTKILVINIQNCMRRLAEDGELLIPIKTFENYLINWCKISKNEVDNIILKCEKGKIINRTTRNFSKEYTISYISMNLDFLTLQSLMWAVKSLYKDGMTPTEKLVISRIKEAFTIKMQQKQWDHLIKCLKLKINDNVCSSSTTAPQHLDIAQNLFIDIAYDNNTSSDVNIIKLKGWEHVPFEDTGDFDHKSSESTWKIFIEFLDHYFAETPISLSESTSNCVVKLNSSNDNVKEDLSNDPLFQKTQTHNTTEPNLSTIIENDGETSLQKKEKSVSSWGKSYQSDSHILPDFSDNEDQRSIPGGRYGCAYFVKSFGPPSLRLLSIGRLSLYVQEALNIGYLRYQRTLILKNEFRKSKATEEESKKIEDPKFGTEQHNEQINLIKKAIIEILIENPRGIPLAQIPHFLKRKLYFPVNFQEIGYPKLKNFLKIMSDQIKIEVSSSNNSYAILLENSGKNSNQNKAQHQTLNIPVPAVKSLSIFSSQFQTALPNEQKTQTKRQPRSRKVSNLEEYLRQTLELLHTLLSRHQMGVEINLLYNQLCNELGYEFDYRVFGCEDFYNFLLNYMSYMIDIEIKKNNMNKILLIIYPKETKFRFGRSATATGNSKNLFHNNSMNDGERPNHQISIIESQHGNDIKSANSFFETDNSMVTKKSVNCEDLNKVLTQHIEDYRKHSPLLERHTNSTSKRPSDENVKRGKGHKRFMSVWSNYDKIDSGDEYNNKPFMFDSNIAEKEGKPNDEESNFTLKDHLKFIDYLLDENPNDHQANTSFKTTGFSEFSSIIGHSPSLSMSAIQPIMAGMFDSRQNDKIQNPYMPPSHNKAFSHDFHFNKFV